ncbi:protein FAM200A-like [Aphis craccivora]|uniref:Protein FAM200A-like n=1 Tax=Aphis craccivora TaxID=307492 RepID=A0A6G0ZJB5_APHCR|nr:protein FAM200A-like [Aphis craccivora]
MRSTGKCVLPAAVGCSLPGIGSIAQYVIYCATPHFNTIFYTPNMLAKEFYSIISSDESTTNFLMSKNLVENNENSECIKLEERGKERRVLRCKRKGCQTTQSLR